MFASKILQCLTSTRCRFICQSAKRLESNAPKTPPPTGNPKSYVPEHSESVVGPRMMIPTDFEKWILVWMKKFPSKEEIPRQIRAEMMYQVKSRARVKAANYITAAAVLACIAAIYSGKKAFKSGDSIQKRNLEWHRKVKEEHEKKINS